MAFDDFNDDVNPYAAPRATEFDAPGDRLASRIEFAGFFERWGAVIIDGIITGVTTLLILVAFVVVLLIAGVDPEGPIEASLNLAGILIAWIYEAGFVSSSYQATPGKMAVGLIVTDENGRPVGFGRATGRHFGKMISMLILFIGFLMQPFTEKKQALHDMMAGTLILKK